MKEVKAPGEYNKHALSVFLAGSIEQDIGKDWRQKLIRHLNGDFADKDLLVLNPFRAAWDPTWRQSLDDLRLKEQVKWELDALSHADIIVMNFMPDTLSPISLLEFGLFADKNKLIVCCPDSFWRKGNVEAVCARHSIPLFKDFQEFTEAVHSRITSHSSKN